MQIISDYERPLFQYMLSELARIPDIRIYGIVTEDELDLRCPTLAFTKAGKTPAEIACQSGSQQGSFVLNAIYGEEKMKYPSLRFSLSHYNTKEEVDRFLSVMKNDV